MQSSEFISINDRTPGAPVTWNLFKVQPTVSTRRTAHVTLWNRLEYRSVLLTPFFSPGRIHEKVQKPSLYLFISALSFYFTQISVWALYALSVFTIDKPIPLLMTNIKNRILFFIWLPTFKEGEKAALTFHHVRLTLSWELIFSADIRGNSKRVPCLR